MPAATVRTFSSLAALRLGNTLTATDVSVPPHSAFANHPTMKPLLHLLALLLLAPQTLTAAETNGFLVFEIDCYTYTADHPKDSKQVRQRFKIPLTAEFLANFQHTPSQNSSGTGFCCAGGNLKSAPGSTRFAWWIRQTTDHRWAINMWGNGMETVAGTQVSSRGATSTQCQTIRRWEDLDMTYQLSYVQLYDGINVSFSARYVAAKDIDAEAPILAAPVKRADRTVLFPGDDQTDSHLNFSCLFQEG